MVSEEFSFPRIRNPISHLAVTPSLWRISSAVYPDHYDEDKVEEAVVVSATKEVSYGKDEKEEVVVSSRKEICYGEESEVKGFDEEKMDMLWEHLNEELNRVPSRGNNNNKNNHKIENMSSPFVSLELVQALKRGKVMVHHKRRSKFMILAMKIFKMMVLVKDKAPIKIK